MTTTTEAPTVTQAATVRADELMRAITNAVLAAGTDDTLATLTAVHFRPGHAKGTLMLEATNRYLASQEEIDLADLAEYDSDWDRAQILKHMEDDHGRKRPEGYDARTSEQVEAQHAALPHGPDEDVHTHTARPVPVTELDCMVNGKDLVKLVKTLKLVIEPETKINTGRAAPHVVITHLPDEKGHAGKVSFMLINNNGTDTTVSPRAVYGDFARIDTLMAAAEESAKAAREVIAEVNALMGDGKPLTPEQVEQLGETLRYITTAGCFNADYLSRFTKIDTGNKIDTVDLHFTAISPESGAPKPMLVKVGQRYRALLVPIRK